MASTKTIEIEIALAIRKALESKALDAGSAMRIVRKGMELLNAYPALRGEEKKAVLIRVLEQVSAGNDGVLGTDDDLLPEATLKAMKALLDGDLIGDIVDTFVAFTKGDIPDTAKVLSIFTRLNQVARGLFECLRPKPKPSAKQAKQTTPTAPAARRPFSMERPLPTMIVNPVAVGADGIIDRMDKRVEPTQVLYSSNVASQGETTVS